MTELINKSGIRKKIKEKGLNTSSTAIDRFDYLLDSIIDEACERAEKNGRKTVMQQDV